VCARAESLLKPAPPFRRDQPPPMSPFAGDEPQSSDGTANNSASQGQEHASSMGIKQVLSGSSA
jgi:hypothetical protein